jgi:hypothetical protein
VAVPTTYLISTKNLDSILDKLRRAGVPAKLTTDFLKQLGFASSGDRPIIPLFKALGFLNGSGEPTERYLQFRDERHSGRVLAEALREAYSDVFELDEVAHTLSPQELKGIFSRVTGKHEDVVEKMATTFKALSARAEFGAVEVATADHGTGVAEPARSSLAAPGDLHPLILGLLQELPAPGEPFPSDKQDDWLEIAKTTFRLIYPNERANGTGRDVGTVARPDRPTVDAEE